MNEFSIINIIRKKFGEKHEDILFPIGDDCSVIRPPKGMFQVTTADSLVDGNHFSSKYFTPKEIGRKAVRVNLSDLASMGAEAPFYAWLTLALPSGLKDEVIKGMLDGMKADCRKYDVRLAGGNITSSSEFSIHITMTGWIKPRLALSRKGAKVGDLIFVTGTIGPSTLAYRQFIAGAKPDGFLLKRWANPIPRLDAGRLLSQGKIANSCIDVSDGIFQDLRHITGQSGVGALLEWNRLPFPPKLRRMKPTPSMIGFGEDYELLFTVPRRKLHKLAELPCRVTRIGEIIPRGFAVLDGDGKEMDVSKTGYNHLT